MNVQSGIPSLFPYQMEDAAVLSNHDRYILGSEMGTGKTAVLLQAFVQRGKHGFVYCPPIAVPVWESEAEKWAPKVLVKVLQDGKDIEAFLKNPRKSKLGIIAYSKFSLRGKELQHAVRQADDPTIIMDEGHFLKNWQAKRTHYCLHSLKNAGAVWWATGTPIVNHYGDLYPVMTTLWPEEVKELCGGVTFPAWQNHFLETRMIPVRGRQQEIVTGSKNAGDLRNLMNDKLIRRTKLEILPDLEPVRHYKLPLPTDVKQSGVWNGLDPNWSDEQVERFFKDVVPAAERRHLGLIRAEACFQWIQDYMEADQTRKLVIFCHHHAVMDKIMETCLQWIPQRIDGKVNTIERRHRLKKFLVDTNARIFLGQIQACNTAISLKGVDTILFIESDPLPGNNAQAAARCHGLGRGLKDGRTPVTAYYATLSTWPTDNRLMATLVRRCREFTAIFG